MAKTKTLKLFAVSQACAWSDPDNGTTDYIHRACYVYSEDDQTAQAYMFGDILSDCPTNIGFINHAVSVMEVPGVTKEEEDGDETNASTEN